MAVICHKCGERITNESEGYFGQFGDYHNVCPPTDKQRIAELEHQLSELKEKYSSYPDEDDPLCARLVDSGTFTLGARLGRSGTMKDWIDRATKAEAELAEVQKAVEKLEAIEAWCRAYPVRSFVPLTKSDWKVARLALQTKNIEIDRISADNYRHVLDGVARIINPPAQKGGQ